MRWRASKATRTVSRMVSSGKRVAAWKLRPSPCRARPEAERAAGSPNSSIEPDDGT